MRRALQLEFPIRTHGGRRAGAGRRPNGDRRNVAHRRRELHARHAPAHVTLRATTLPASLRAPAMFAAVRGAIARASTDAFRIVAFSVQHDHVHLVVEADGALARGVQGLTIRVAKAVNRVLGRHGQVWSERYHARDLTTPRAVRHALVYVLQNHRKHGHDGMRLDPCSSALWLDEVEGDGIEASVVGARRHAPHMARAVWVATARPAGARRDAGSEATVRRRFRHVMTGRARRGESQLDGW